jgi:hypothetical protein
VRQSLLGQRYIGENRRASRSGTGLNISPSRLCVTGNVKSGAEAAVGCGALARTWTVGDGRIRGRGRGRPGSARRPEYQVSPLIGSYKKKQTHEDEEDEEVWGGGVELEELEDVDEGDARGC